VGGAAGEIGYLPVPGVGLPENVRRPATGAFQSLAGASVVRRLAAGFGFGGGPGSDVAVATAAVTAAAADAAAGGERGREFLAELASRVALGVAAISVVLDPGLVVLGGSIGLAGGSELARRVAADVGRICPATPRVVPTQLTSGPVLRGAMLAAVDTARDELLASVAAS